MARRILTEMKNPLTKMYLALLSFILNNVNKHNLEFQTEGYRMHKLKRATKAGMKGILSNFIRPDLLSVINAYEINVNDATTHQPLDCIYFDAAAERILYENATTIAPDALLTFQQNILRFFVSLSNQMLMWFSSRDMQNNLGLLEALDPTNVVERRPRSIIPSLCDEKDFEEIIQEWRHLTVQCCSFIPYNEPEKFWFAVSQEKCGDEYRYPLLSSFMLCLLSLPHSSASSERILSVFHNIKTKNRNCLKTSTLNALTRSKTLIRNTDCTTWEPDEQLCKTLFEKRLIQHRISSRR
ncbi:hat family dimerization domaincontaining protein-related [Octopus vulgaris]|uniref:Hat family dimerization domaincontaining protein-related n=1 Tax=Octopus vulgaris TaxID=6645 RepID=A0AA36F275_OCTVU|nr:hat family dimerization domaincontaining protein-related [Octopus vulgaris]